MFFHVPFGICRNTTKYASHSPEKFRSPPSVGVSFFWAKGPISILDDAHDGEIDLFLNGRCDTLIAMVELNRNGSTDQRMRCSSAKFMVEMFNNADSCFFIFWNIASKYLKQISVEWLFPLVIQHAWRVGNSQRISRWKTPSDNPTFS